MDLKEGKSVGVKMGHVQFRFSIKKFYVEKCKFLLINMPEIWI